MGFANPVDLLCIVNQTINILKDPETIPIDRTTRLHSLLKNVRDYSRRWWILPWNWGILPQIFRAREQELTLVQIFALYNIPLPS